MSWVHLCVSIACYLAAPVRKQWEAPEGDGHSGELNISRVPHLSLSFPRFYNKDSVCHYLVLYFLKVPLKRSITLPCFTEVGRVHNLILLQKQG